MWTRRKLIGTMAAAAAIAPTLTRTEEIKRLPVKAYDGHAHFFSDELAKYPLADKRGAPFAVNIDNLKAQITATPDTAKAMFEWWDAANIESGAGIQYFSAYGTDNRFVMDCAAAHPKRISAVLILDSVDPATPNTLRTLARHQGVIGIRIIAGEQNGGYPMLTSDAALNTLSTLNELGLSLDVMFLKPGNLQHVQQSTADQLAAIARRFPNMPIALDHFGWLNKTYGLAPAHAALLPHKNVYFKYTCLLRKMYPSMDSGEFLYDAVKACGADRILWGSDMGNGPQSYAWRIDDALNAVRRLNTAQQRAVLHDTGYVVFASNRRHI